MLSYWNWTSQNDIQSKYSSSRVYAVVPTETNCPNATCGWNEVTQSAKRMDCPTCHGRGKLVTNINYAISCRLVWSGLMGFNYQAPSPGIQFGECLITVNGDFKTIMETVLNSPRAYFLADGKPVRPLTEHEQNIETLSKEYEFVCKSYNPE